MDAERWGRIEELCEAVAAMPDAERHPYLLKAAGGDATLVDEVESLVRELEASPGFLSHPLIARPEPQEPVPDVLPVSIGPYRVERRLGRGGMGEVYLATRDVGGVRQEVAIKVIRRGMDTEEVLRRFRLELRILASLHHPNIAALIDAGATADGRPYFVMEYVNGVPITDHCDALQLTVPARIRLVQAVARAVGHAHQRLVVHRDLKPRNVLVTPEGEPKLLDFGIGKVLAPTDTLGTAVETRAELRLFTPDYAAPEQVAGGAITTATDVFALGVLLYELLTGRRPLAGARGEGLTSDPAERAATVVRPSVVVTREGPVAPDPVDGAQAGGAPIAKGRASSRELASRRGATPDALRRSLAGDLDTIILTALRPEPERRYPSALALVDDLQRHLDALPVLARADTLGYRTRKFVQRHTGGVAAGVALVGALVVTSVVTLVQSRRVAREAARAERERDQALEVRGFLMEMFGASGADQAVGATVTARALLDRQVAQVDNAYRDRPELHADMLEVLADGYDRLGLYAEAEPLAQRALDERRSLLGGDHPDVAASLNLLGWIRHERGQSREAEPLLLDAARIRRAGGERLRGDLSRTLNDLGVTYNATRRFADAERVLREALAVRRSEFGDAHRAVGITANNLAAALYFQQKFDSAIATQALAVSSLEKSVGPDHQRSVVALGNLVAFKRAKGDLVSVESDYRALLERQTRLQGPDHPVTARIQMSLAFVVGERGRQKGLPDALAEADSLFRRSIATLETRIGPQHPQVGQNLFHLAFIEAARGRVPESLATMRRALPILQRAFGDTSRMVREAQQHLRESR